ncbi:MAG: ATPase [Bacteroidaceae bacterium]
MESLLIADSGSTKTDWAILIKSDEEEQNSYKVERLCTKGLNPFFQTIDEMTETMHEVKKWLVENSHSGILPSLSSIFFYGAGCAFPEKNAEVEKAIHLALEGDYTLSVNSDLLGAARALCGHSAGIACILGTGSNSCYYDGINIAKQVSPLGFILGDEGSGAVLGKRFIGDLLKGQLPTTLCEAFLKEYQLTPAIIIERVYKKPFPNRFLASFSPFILKNFEAEPKLKELVKSTLKDFFTRNVMQYPKLPIHLTGSIAYYYQSLLSEVTQDLGLNIKSISASPIENLIVYHQA